MVRGLRKPGDLLARSELCHLHDGREEAESCAIDPPLAVRDPGASRRSGRESPAGSAMRSRGRSKRTRVVPAGRCDVRGS